MLKMLAALPISGLTRRPDIVLALMVSAIVAMLIIPLPTFMLDGLIAINIAAALIVLLVALFAAKALDVSTFPTLLLMTTLFRLGLNVSTTRGILAHGDPGDVVTAFGEFVVQGDIVVGMVIFLVITLVQFMVIAKGAERVAEVGARFTLDAMPGKQMSIDAACRSGAISEEEAQDRRDELQRASQMFGNMDGAMKFVKGDAIAGLIITAINLVAGISIGTLRLEMDTGAAIETFCILSVGDGLVSQISALLVTLAAGILVTRVEAKNKDENLGFSLKREILGNTKVLNIGAGLMLVMAIVPGLPAIPFVMCAGFVLSLNVSNMFLMLLTKKAKSPGQATLARQLVFKEKLDRKVEEAKKQKSLADKLSPSVVPIGIDLDPKLSEYLNFESEDQDDDNELLSIYIPQLRDALYLETGVRFPGVRVRPMVKTLPEFSFMVRINDVPVMQERIQPDFLLATSAPENLRRLAINARPIQHPISKAKMSLIEKNEKEVVEASGVTVWNAAGMVALYVAGVLRKKAKGFIGLQEVSELIERLEKAYPALVKEVVPKVTSVPQLVNVLRRLVDENVSIRDLKSIVEALGEFGTMEGDGLFLTERVRSSLSGQLAYAYAGLENRLPVVLLDPMIEETIESGIVRTAHGQMLSLEPEIAREIVQTIAGALQPMVAQGKRPVILTNPDVRRFVRKLIETDLPSAAVLSYDELPPDLTIQPMGRAELTEAAA